MAARDGPASKRDISLPSAVGVGFHMSWTQLFAGALDTPPRWFWLAVSLVPDIAMLVCIAWLWRALARTRLEARRQLAETTDTLARRTETLRWATELADVGVWFWTFASGVVEWSDRARAQFALPPGRLPNTDSFFSVIHPDDLERVRAAIDAAVAGRQDYRTVFRAVHPDGSHHWIAAMGRARYATDGTPVSMGGVTLDVTRLRAIESELRGLQVATKEQATELDLARRFRLFAENASDVVMETDNAGRIRWISPSVRLRIGIEPAEAIGERFSQFVHPGERDRVRAMEDQVSRGTAAETRLRLRIAAGGYQWFSVSLRPVFDDQQTVIGRVGGWRDIHREVQAQEVVAAERLRLRATLEGMLDPLAIIEPTRDDEGHVEDFAYLDVNPAACSWLGMNRDHLVGTRLRETLPEVDSSGLLRALAELADTGRPLVLDDFPFMLRGVGLRRLDVRGIQGDGWISLAWRDVTERHDATEKLAASEEQFRLLAENSTDVILRLDANDTVLWISPSVRPVLEWTQAECVGRDGTTFLATAETRAQYDRDKARVLAGQAATSRAQLRAASGDVHWMEVRTFPYRTAEGAVTGMVASMHVIDAEVRMEHDLEHRARIDELTGLLNRRELLERLAGMLAGGKPAVGLLWCDIDGFKAINDSRGHAAGDAVLEALGARIRGSLGPVDDMGGRMGGDELVVVLGGIDGLAAAVAHAEQLRRRAAEPIPAGDDLIEATISIGVTLAGPEEGIDALLARADDAMYQAKNQGKNRVLAIPPPVAATTAS
jgi:diguanylate cyclase (GGDEF)-like protein/PAS domain S-box-containing protein